MRAYLRTATASLQRPFRAALVLECAVRRSELGRKGELGKRDETPCRAAFIVPHRESGRRARRSHRRRLSTRRRQPFGSGLRVGGGRSSSLRRSRRLFQPRFGRAMVISGWLRPTPRRSFCLGRLLPRVPQADDTVLCMVWHGTACGAGHTIERRGA